jgi:hypothetical protein
VAAVVEDPDVTAERQRVLEAAAAGIRRDIISITSLRKQYDNNSGKVSTTCVPDVCVLSALKSCAEVLYVADPDADSGLLHGTYFRP